MMTNEQILQIRFTSGDLDRSLTIKEYLKELLTELWREGEGFSGKRPFGNSGWEYDIYAALVRNKVIKGEFDDDEYLEDYDSKLADKKMLEVIASL